MTILTWVLFSVRVTWDPCSQLAWHLEGELGILGLTNGSVQHQGPVQELQPGQPILIDGFVRLATDRKVNQHLERDVTISKTTVSKLTFSYATKKDEGTYTCSPSDIVPVTVKSGRRSYRNDSPRGSFSQITIQWHKPLNDLCFLWFMSLMWTMLEQRR